MTPITIRIAFFFALTLGSHILHAQLNISAGIGYGSYAMIDLKKLQTQFKNSTPVGMKQMSNYPAFFNYTGRIEYELTKSFSIGIIAEYGSSGSRLDYHDYSGSIQYDQVARYWRLSSSIALSKGIWRDKFILEFELQPGVVYTNLNVANKVKIGNDDYSQLNQFSSVNWALQPSISIKKVFNQFMVYSYLGFQADFAKGKLVWSADSNYHLEDNYGNEVHANWSGLRTGVGIKYHFQI